MIKVIGIPLVCTSYPWHLLVASCCKLRTRGWVRAAPSSTPQGHKLVPAAMVGTGLCLDLVEKRPTAHR